MRERFRRGARVTGLALRPTPFFQDAWGIVLVVVALLGGFGGLTALFSRVWGQAPGVAGGLAVLGFVVAALFFWAAYRLQRQADERESSDALIEQLSRFATNATLNSFFGDAASRGAFHSQWDKEVLRFLQQEMGPGYVSRYIGAMNKSHEWWRNKPEETLARQLQLKSDTLNEFLRELQAGQGRISKGMVVNFPDIPDAPKK